MALVSCSDQYTIQGTSSVTVVDGKVFDGSKLYLKVLKDTDFTVYDSCEVVHGQFKFAGLLDTTYMAMLFMGDQPVMPLVVEKGDISVCIDDMQRKVSGSPLNDRLYEFLEKQAQMDNRKADLQRRYPQMLLEGVDEQTIDAQLTAEAEAIMQQEDSLVTDFVTTNFDNVMAPYVMAVMTTSLPQIEHIMSQAPDAFKTNPFVSKFYQAVAGGEEPQGVPAGPADADNPDGYDDAAIQDILNGRSQ